VSGASHGCRVLNRFVVSPLMRLHGIKCARRGVAEEGNVTETVADERNVERMPQRGAGLY